MPQVRATIRRRRNSTPSFPRDATRKIKEAVRYSLLNNIAVPFTADVNHARHDEFGILDPECFSHESLLGVSQVSVDKAANMETFATTPNHAMLFVGVGTVSNGDVVPGYHVLNSWGDGGVRKGFFLMSDKWFDAFVFEVALHRDVVQTVCSRGVGEGRRSALCRGRLLHRCLTWMEKKRRVRRHFYGFLQ